MAEPIGGGGDRTAVDHRRERQQLFEGDLHAVRPRLTGAACNALRESRPGVSPGQDQAQTASSAMSPLSCSQLRRSSERFLANSMSITASV